jgi:fused signal recognition particle receptor
MPFFEVAALNDDEFGTILSTVQASFDAEQERKAEEERERKEQQERDRKVKEKEKELLAVERAEIDRLRKEQAEKEASLKAEQDHIDAEKKVLEDEKHKAELKAEREENQQKMRVACQIAEQTILEGERKEPPKADENGPRHEYIIEDLDGDPVRAEIILYADDEIEIGLSDLHSGMRYYCNAGKFEDALKQARAKLNI